MDPLLNSPSPTFDNISRESALNATQTALKVREQMDSLLGIVFPHFSKPICKFLHQMVFGIQSAKDIKLSPGARALDEPSALQKTEERLSRNIQTEGLDVQLKWQSLWKIVEADLSRWRVEEAIRFMKQMCPLEDLRLLSWQRLKNRLGALLLALYFISMQLRLAIRAGHIITASKRFYGVAEFGHYARADGVGALLSRLRPKRPPHRKQTSQDWLPGFCC